VQAGFPSTFQISDDFAPKVQDLDLHFVRQFAFQIVGERRACRGIGLEETFVGYPGPFIGSGPLHFGANIEEVDVFFFNLRIQLL